MRVFLLIVCLFLVAGSVWAAGNSPLVPPPVVDLDSLVTEALGNNQEIRAAVRQMVVMDARAVQAGSVDDPVFTFMREEMPQFNWSEAQMQRLELMQMLPLPMKLSARREVADIVAEHAHHDHLEKTNEIIAKLKSAYAELWYSQRTVAILEESRRLLGQFAEIAKTKFSVGAVPQQDVLKAMVEIGKLDNQIQTLRQEQSVAKSMLMAILNRNPQDTLGTAILPDTVIFTPNPDSLVALALQYRPMLLHDSLGVEEGRAMQTLARREYLPDLKLGLQYVTEPVGTLRGWSVIAGVSIPFAPWTLGKASARVEEADANFERAVASYHASRDMIVATVQEMYTKASSHARQVRTYRQSILPLAEQSLKASLTAYQNGTSDFLMLIDAHRMLLDLRMESLMQRMEFEQSVAELERAVGITGIATMK